MKVIINSRTELYILEEFIFGWNRKVRANDASKSQFQESHPGLSIRHFSCSSSIPLLGQKQLKTLLLVSIATLASGSIGAAGTASLRAAEGTALGTESFCSWVCKERSSGPASQCLSVLLEYHCASPFFCPLLNSEITATKGRSSKIPPRREPKETSEVSE